MDRLYKDLENERRERERKRERDIVATYLEKRMENEEETAEGYRGKTERERERKEGGERELVRARAGDMQPANVTGGEIGVCLAEGIG